VQQQLTHRAAAVGPDAHVLSHVGERADVDVAVVGGQDPGEHAEQRRLADAVGSNQADVLPGRYPERDVGEQQVAARVGVGEVRDDDMGHRPRLCDAAGVRESARTDSPVVRGIAVVAGMAALMWVVEVADQVAGGRLDRNGIEPRELDGLDGVVWAPFLHGGFDHLVGNTIPFLLLGFAIALSGVARVVLVTATVAVVGGLGTWLVAPANTVHIGASGIVFGYAGYLVARGAFSRSAGQIVLGVAVVAVWGATLLRGLVPETGISWQGHLFGAIGGVVAARLLHRRAAAAAPH
jgi:membrane associated rhomboid family serine protease